MFRALFADAIVYILKVELHPINQQPWLETAYKIQFGILKWKIGNKLHTMYLQHLRTFVWLVAVFNSGFCKYLFKPSGSVRPLFAIAKLFKKVFLLCGSRIVQAWAYHEIVMFSQSHRISTASLFQTFWNCWKSYPILYICSWGLFSGYFSWLKRYLNSMTGVLFSLL